MHGLQQLSSPSVHDLACLGQLWLRGYDIHCNHIHRVLLRREADPSKEILEEGVSLTPEDLAWKGQHPEVAQRISLTCTERADRLTEKIKQGTLNLADLFLSDYSSSNSDKKSLLMVAVEHDQPRLVKALINRSSKDFRNCEVCGSLWCCGIFCMRACHAPYLVSA